MSIRDLHESVILPGLRFIPGLVCYALNGETIAKRIIEVACDGECDPDEACARALRAFGFQQSPNC